MDFFTNINIIFYILAYLVGSIPFGLILAKYFAGVDVKAQGSKSIGATNVLRVVKEKNPSLAKKLGFATLLCDALKGLLIILVAMMLDVNQSTLWAMAILSILGHCYSIYLGFEGGKGVATAFGCLLILIPLPTLIGIIIWAICAKVLKISSLSSLLGLLFVVISAVFLNNGLEINSNVPLYIIFFIIFYKHIPNLIRLINGEEQKVVLKK